MNQFSVQRAEFINTVQYVELTFDRISFKYCWPKNVLRKNKKMMRFHLNQV